MAFSCSEASGCQASRAPSSQSGDCLFCKLKTCLAAFAATLGAAASLIATQALAAPVTWTIPATPTYSSGALDGGSISGTFVFDAALPPADRLVSINVVETGPTPTTYSFTGGVAGPYHVGQESAVAVVLSTRILALDLSSIPSTSGGSHVVPTIILQPCRGETSGKCNDFAGIRRSEDVTISSAGPAAVPTMNEWAMILMGVILAGGAAVLVQRRRMAI